MLNRVAEDGVLPDWFRHPHKKFGTTSRLINLIVILQFREVTVARERRRNRVRFRPAAVHKIVEILARLAGRIHIRRIQSVNFRSGILCSRNNVARGNDEHHRQ